MATRFYLPSSGSLPSGVGSVTVGSGWEVATGVTTLAAPRAKSNTALANGSGQSKNGTANSDRLDRVYVSEPLAAQTISGTFSMVIRGVESNTLLDAWLNVMVRVLSGDGSTVKATLYTGSIATTEGTSTTAENFELTASTSVTAMTTRTKSAITLSSYDCADGDRLSFEIGFRGNGTSTAYTVTYGYGDPASASDLALSVNSSTAGVPWIELSQNLTFYSPPDNPPPGDGEVTPRGGVFAMGTVTAFGDGNSADATKPAGLAVGDLMAAFVTTSGDSPSATDITSPGWQGTFWDDAGTAGTRTNSAVLTKVATSADVSGGGWTFTKVGVDGNDQFLVHVVAFGGIDTTDPILAGPIMLEGPFTPLADVQVPSLTIPAGLPGQAVLICNWVGFWWDDPPGGNRWTTSAATELVDQSTSWAQMLTGYTMVGAGSTGVKVATGVGSGAGDPFSQSPYARGHALALRPAGGGAAAPTDAFFHVLA